MKSIRVNIIYVSISLIVRVKCSTVVRALFNATHRGNVGVGARVCKLKRSSDGEANPRNFYTERVLLELVKWNLTFFLLVFCYWLLCVKH